MLRKHSAQEALEQLTITSLRRDAVLGAFSLRELKALPVNLRLLLYPSLAFALHVFMLTLWGNRIHSHAQGSGFGVKLWTSVPLVFTIIYVSLSYLGIRVMRMNPLLDEGVREAMVIFHIYQVAFNCYLFLSLIAAAKRAGLSLWGNSLGDEGDEYRHRVAKLVWLHYYNQYTRLLDTLFIVARKKASQMTPLHVYTRTLSIWCWFIVSKLGCATGDVFLGAALLSGVECLYYMFYLLGLLGVKEHSSWKPFLTKIRMTSLSLILVQACLSWIWGRSPSLLAIAQFVSAGNVLLFYVDFHEQTQKNAKNQKSSKHRRIVFSFDSSGWFYVYHYGVARYLEVHVLPKLSKSQAGFSGSSGGSLVGATLCAGFEVDHVVDHVISCQPDCEWNPWKMLPAAEEYLEKFKTYDLAKVFSGRLSVLVTRSLYSFPFFKGEAVSDFKSTDDALGMLRASCHVPLLGGILPYKHRGCYYYDGFFWPSFFVPWRSLHRKDKVLKSSAIGTLGAQISPSIMLPVWWMCFPPKGDVLRGMYQLGYSDAARFFRTWPDYLDDIKGRKDGSLEEKGIIPKTPTGRARSKKSITNRKVAESMARAMARVEMGTDYIPTLEVAVYKGWFWFAFCIAGTWLVGLTLYALHVN